jgi:hypothetical protein
MISLYKKKLRLRFGFFISSIFGLYNLFTLNLQ